MDVEGLPACSFKDRLFPHAGPLARRRFLKEMEDYVAAVTTEVQLRDNATILDLRSYERLRRLNSGMPGCFEMYACLFGVDLPDMVYHHPAFQQMYFAAVDMTSWANVSVRGMRWLVWRLPAVDRTCTRIGSRSCADSRATTSCPS